MRLLIITQRVDRKDPILGFFHRWIEEFSRRCDRVTVIGQAVGEHHFAQNVRVLSLRKEKGLSVPRQIVRFWRLIVRQARSYDAVLVHMTPVWVVLGSPVWFLLRKRVYLWYEVRRGGWMLKLAVALSRSTFAATPAGVPFVSSKVKVVGHGIDTSLFAPRGERDPSLVITVGRMTRIKGMDVIVEAFATLPQSMRLTIVGGPVTQEDHHTLLRLRERMDALALPNRVSLGFHTQEETADLLSRSTLFLHAAGGGLDKAVLEAMASGCLVATTSVAARHALPDRCLATDGKTLAQVAQSLLALPAQDQEALRKDLRERVIRDHSLPRLIGRLVGEMR